MYMYNFIGHDTRIVNNYYLSINPQQDKSQQKQLPRGTISGVVTLIQKGDNIILT